MDKRVSLWSRLDERSQRAQGLQSNVKEMSGGGSRQSQTSPEIRATVFLERSTEVPGPRGLRPRQKWGPAAPSWLQREGNNCGLAVRREIKSKGEVIRRPLLWGVLELFTLNLSARINDQKPWEWNSRKLINLCSDRAFVRCQTLDWAYVCTFLCSLKLRKDSGSPTVETIKTEAQGQTAGAQGGRASNPGWCGAKSMPSRVAVYAPAVYMQF